MRVSPVVAALIAFVALPLARPASAAGDPNWQACAGLSTTPEQRVAACTAVIDGKTETGGRLAGAYCSRGYGLTEQRLLDAALADLDEAIRLDPAYPCPHNNRGRVYAMKRDFDRAISDYDEAIRLQPSFALAYNNRGDARLARGDVPQAMTDFDAAIRLDPKLAIAYGNRAYIYYRMHDFAHAIADYSTQIKLRPDLLAYINRGNAYRNSEQLDRAAADYAKVIRLAPEDARGWRNRGLIRLFQGDNKGGHRRLRQGAAIRFRRRQFLAQPRPGQAAGRRPAGRDRRFPKGARAGAGPRGCARNLRKLGVAL